MEITHNDKEFAEYALEFVKNNPNYFYDIYCTPSKYAQSKFSDSLKEFKNYHELVNKKQCVKLNTRSIGDILEDLVTSIFEIPIFKVCNGVRTNSNEIDHLVKIDPTIAIKLNPIVHSCVPSYFICECKNYDSKVAITWINKFHSLMESTNTYLGIIFSYHGFTGSSKCGGWLEASGFARKVLIKSMGKEDDSKERYILDFNLIDLEKLSNGSKVLEMIEDKKLKLRLDIKNEIQYNGIRHENISIINSKLIT